MRFAINNTIGCCCTRHLKHIKYWKYIFISQRLIHYRWYFKLNESALIGIHGFLFCCKIIRLVFLSPFNSLSFTLFSPTKKLPKSLKLFLPLWTWMQVCIVISLVNGEGCAITDVGLFVSGRPPVSSSVRVSVRPPVCLSVRPFVRPSVLLSVCQPVCLSVRLSAFHFISNITENVRTDFDEIFWIGRTWYRQQEISNGIIFLTIWIREFSWILSYPDLAFSRLLGLFHARQTSVTKVWAFWVVHACGVITSASPRVSV